MNYSKITLLKNKHNKTRNEMAAMVDLTPAGYDKMMRHQTISVKTLEKMASFFKVPISFFFEENNNDDTTRDPDAEYGNCKECLKYEGMLEFLKEKLKECEGRIEHTGAGKLLESGASLAELMSHLGHTKFESTIHYVRRHFGEKSEKIMQFRPDFLNGL